MKNLTHSPRFCRTAAFITCIAITLSLILFFIFSFKTPDYNPDPIYASVFRLHIRANSNSDADQATKLAVRDALLPFTAELFADCGGLSDAVLVAEAEKDAITAHINASLSALGADYSARINIGKENFPERNYAGEVYPAGEYTALIVELGEGVGDNWWCVLFPSLCLSAVKSEEALEVGISASQFESITASSDEKRAETPKYRLKFRFLELIDELFDR